MVMIKKELCLKRNHRASVRNHGLVDYRSNIFKLYIYNIFMGFYLLSGVIIPFYLIWGQLTFMQFLFLQSYYVLVILIFEIPFGAISDYIGKKIALFLSGLMYALGSLCYVWQPTIFLFIIGETLFAFGEALTAGSNEALMYDSLKSIGRENEYSKRIAKSDSIFLLSMAISASFGSIIALNYSFSILMILMFFPYIIGTILALTFHEPFSNKKPLSVHFLSTLNSGFKELKNNKILRILTLDMIIIEILILFLFYTYQFYLYKLHVPIVYFGIIASSYYFIQIGFTYILPKVEHQIKNKKKYLIINTITPGIAYALIGVIYFTPVLILLILIIFGFGFSRYILYAEGINNLIKEENRVTVLNTINTIRLLLKVILFPIIACIILLDLELVFFIIGVSIIFLALKSRVKKEYL